MDFILKKIKDAKARDSLIVPFKPINDSKIAEVSARFDIVLGGGLLKTEQLYSLKS